MECITSTILKQFLEQDKRKFEGLFPDLVKRLILSSCRNITSIRIPGLDDVWAPGFDGIIESQERTTYVADGKSIWEMGTNADSLRKINEDYKKRTENPLGIDKATTSFYLVIPRIWAYDNKGISISQWESDHQNDGWRNVRVYDASILCDWINSEPAVCAWLFEQFGQNKHMNFSTVAGAWESFSNQTDPPLTFSMFMEGRQNESSEFQDAFNQKICRIKSTSFMDAYGFCLSALIQNSEKSNQVIVVNNEATYHVLNRFSMGKVFLLSFPFSGQVSDDNYTIVCFSKETPFVYGMIELSPLWQTQFKKALREMGLSDVQASECYSFTHGSLLSLIRRIPGNTTELRPKWVNTPDVEVLYPIVFIRQFCAANELEKCVLEEIAGVDYSHLESRYEAFLRMEDAPIKRLDNCYYIVNFEEAWLTLQISISDLMSSRMYDTVITLLSDCKEIEIHRSQVQASLIKRLIYNYIYFAQTGSEQEIINNQVRVILEFVKKPECKDIIFDSLSNLAEAAPEVTLDFIESELEQGIIVQVFKETDSWSGNYQKVLWALDKLVKIDGCAIRSCKTLYTLCQINREYRTSNSPKDSLLNALCLWDNHTALNIEEKKHFAIRFIEDNSSFGVLFAIDLIAKSSVFRGIRPGEKEHKFGEVTTSDLYSAYRDITLIVLNTSITEKRVDWIAKILTSYWYIPCEVLYSLTDLLTVADFNSVQKMPLIYQIRHILFSINKYSFEKHQEWIEPLNKWIECLITDDPVSKEGWRFYKYYQAPFPELLSESEDNYQKIEERTLDIRKLVFADVREKYGADTIMQLVSCMEDDMNWGIFLSNNLMRDEIVPVALFLLSNRKKFILAELISLIELPLASEIYKLLSFEEKEIFLPLLNRDDIDEWLNTPEYQFLYWKTKRLSIYDDRAYHYLMKYNPCGILPIFLNQENQEDTFNKLLEVIRAIVDSANYSDMGLLTLIVQRYDNIQHYSDEWAELCLKLYKHGVFSSSYRYYPVCLRIYFFRYPEGIVKEYYDDYRSFYGHFHYDYYLPDEAYENQDAFMDWTDYIYNISKEELHFVSTFGSILGRSVLGKDGIFPHEYVRIVIEKYSSDALTRNVATGWFNARGARVVLDGLNEKKMELLYRNQARSLELNYPQTAKLLNIMADYCRDEAKEDQQYSEMFPL